MLLVCNLINSGITRGYRTNNIMVEICITRLKKIIDLAIIIRLLRILVIFVHYIRYKNYIVFFFFCKSVQTCNRGT